MRMFTSLLRGAALLAVFAVAACQDNQAPTEPLDQPSVRVDGQSGQLPEAAREVMALPRTVFAARDDATGQLVFGIEHRDVGAAVRGIMARHGFAASAYRIEITEPIHFMETTLRTAHRPTRGGIQIHWSQYVCTLGFNVDHSGGRSFVTNSHCTNNQGTTGNTAYYQPTSSAQPTPIADEAHDPSYFTGGACPSNRQCRYSDAARALYRSGTGSNQGEIARTTGVNNGSLDVVGVFTITEQNNTSTTFSGTIHKVGRTTGWSSGNVTSTCANVNVSGTNITLLCQTLVQRNGRSIVGGGDSGSPVFQTLSGNNVRLVGILWGGNSQGSLFVFSPLKNIQDELGNITATSSGGGGGDDGGGDDGGGSGGGGNCPPGNPGHRNCQ